MGLCQLHYDKYLIFLKEVEILFMTWSSQSQDTTPMVDVVEYGSPTVCVSDATFLKPGAASHTI